MAPSVPVTKRSRWSGLRATTDTGPPEFVVKAESIRMNVDQPVALPQYAEWMPPSAPATKRSRWSGLRATTDPGPPGFVVKAEWIRKKEDQPALTMLTVNPPIRAAVTCTITPDAEVNACPVPSAV